MELVEAGWNALVEPFDSEQVASNIIRCLNLKGDLKDYLYGLGDAAEKILHQMIFLAH